MSSVYSFFSRAVKSQHTNAKRMVLWVFIATAFLSGLLFCVFGGGCGGGGGGEGFESQELRQDQDEKNLKDVKSLCPDLLVNEGGQYKLHFSNASSVDGVNPLVFASLADYSQYQQRQSDAGRACPAPIYSQREEDAQGKEVYRLYPSPYAVEGGLPPLPLTLHDNSQVAPYVDASRENPPFNANQYAGISSLNMDEGVYDELDRIHDKTKRKNKCPSYNAMDSNWGGADFSMSAVQRGKFDDNQVFIPMYPNFKPK